MDRMKEKDSSFPVLPCLPNLDNLVNAVYFFSVLFGEIHATASSVWNIQTVCGF